MNNCNGLYVQAKHNTDLTRVRLYFIKATTLFLSMYFNFNMNRVECWEITNIIDHVRFFSLEIVLNLTGFKKLASPQINVNRTFMVETNISETTGTIIVN